MLYEKIAKHMKDSGKSQTYISDKTGISIQRLNGILRGKRALLAEEYFIICKALNVPYDLFASNQDHKAS